MMRRAQEEERGAGSTLPLSTQARITRVGPKREGERKRERERERERESQKPLAPGHRGTLASSLTLFSPTRHMESISGSTDSSLAAFAQTVLGTVRQVESNHLCILTVHQIFSLSFSLFFALSLSLSLSLSLTHFTLTLWVKGRWRRKRQMA